MELRMLFVIAAVLLGITCVPVAGFNLPGDRGAGRKPCNFDVRPPLSLHSSTFTSDSRSCVVGRGGNRVCRFGRADEESSDEKAETNALAKPALNSLYEAVLDGDIEEIQRLTRKGMERQDEALNSVYKSVLEADKERMQVYTKKAINLLFLCATFGYGLYTVLTIDSEITRGWTQSEIAMRIPLDNWSNYENSLEAKPIFTKTLINVVIYLLGDWLSQTAFQGKNVLEFDVARTLRNGFIGLCFGPLVHLYYEFSDSILPVEGGNLIRLQKILMDQTLYLTVKCSIYISAVGLLSGDDLSTVKQTVEDKIGGIVVTAWKFWPLVHCITYGLIPARHRILWVNSVDLIWNAILATKASKENSEEDVPEEMSVSEEEERQREIVVSEIEPPPMIENLASDDLESIEVIIAESLRDTNTRFNQTEASLLVTK